MLDTKKRQSEYIKYHMMMMKEGTVFMPKLHELGLSLIIFTNLKSLLEFIDKMLLPAYVKRCHLFN